MLFRSIESAKVNRIITEAQQFNIAAVDFKKKYKWWPGDYLGFLSGNCGSSSIGYCTYRGKDGIINITHGLSNEGLFFFEFLRVAGYLNSKFVVPANGTSVCGASPCGTAKKTSA